MTTYQGTGRDDLFSLHFRDAAYQTTVDGGAGEDKLIIDWSGMKSSLWGNFEVNGTHLYDGYMATRSGNYYSVYWDEIEALDVDFTVYDDQFSITSNIKASLNGGDGTDRIVVDNSDEVEDLVINFGDSDVTIVDELTIVNFEVLHAYGGAGNDRITGGSMSDLIAGGSGRNFLNGRGGNDRFEIVTGVNIIDGGSGYDTWSGDFSRFRKVVPLMVRREDDGSYYVNNGSSVKNVETVDIRGGEVGDYFEIVGSGSGHIGGGLGDDRLLLDLSGESAAISSNSDRYGSLEIADYRFTSFESIEIRFGTGNDSFESENATAVILTGGAGDDRLAGGAGGDLLIGGSGADVLNGGGGVDKASYVGADGPVRVNLGLARPQDTGGAGSDTLSNIEQLLGSSFNDILRGSVRSDRLTGGDGADRLRGGRGDDDLLGGKGSDFLSGGDGSDRMLGGTGGDLFIFDAAGADIVFDWEDSAGSEIASDRLDRLSFTGLRDINGGAALSRADLIIEQAGSDVRISLDLDRDGVRDSIDFDGNGSIDAFSITLKNASAEFLTDVDFVF